MLLIKSDDEITRYCEDAFIGLGDIAYDIGEVKHQLAVYAVRKNKQFSELQDILDTVLDACPADTLTRLLRGDPDPTGRIRRSQQKKSG